MTIFSQRRINGSDSPFIHGETKVVCFQDAPLSGICQNAYFEQRYREEKSEVKQRYSACGLMFEKLYVFSKRGRPVIYDRVDDAKSFLRPDQWWRIVNIDFNDSEDMVDWMHEREWRVPGDLAFDIRKATVILPDAETYRDFIEQCAEELPDVPLRLRGIVVMSNILY
jgi:hypothetical protein